MTTTMRLIIDFFVALLLATVPTYATAADISFHSVKACPPDITIRHILKDSNGFIWLGSDNAVFRYDGIHVIPYNLISESSDKVILVKDMVETPDGDIIVATDCGLYILSGKNGTSADAIPFLQEKISGANSLALHPDGYVLIATNNALWSYSLLRGTVSKIQIDRNPLSQTNIPAAITTIPRGVVMVAIDGGIYRIENNFRVIRLKHPGSKFPKPSKAKATSGGLYLATDANGLWRGDLNGNVTKISDVDANVITSLTCQGDSILYVGTDGDGIYKINPAKGVVTGRITHDPKNASSLQSNQIYSLTVDNESNLWVGHYQHGIDHTLQPHEGVEFHILPTEDKAVRTIDILPDRSIVAGTRVGLIILSPSGETVVKSISRSVLRSNIVISTNIKGDSIFVGTYGGGLSVLRLSTLQPFQDADILPESMNSSHIFSIADEVKTNAMWFGTSDGLFRHDKNGLTHFTSENSPLPKGNVFFVFFDSSGKGWIATEEGLAIWDPSLRKLRTDCFPEGFISKGRVRQIYEGKNRKLYFVLENGKFTVSSIDMTEFSRPEIFSKRNYIIKAVAEDSRGFVWLSTSHGLLRWDKQTKITLFANDNGIPLYPFIHCVPARNNDILYFGNSRGMLEADTRILDKLPRQKPLIPSVCITADNTMTDNFTDKKGDSSYSVRYDDYSRSLTIKFTTLTFDDPDASKYEYRVNDGEWMAMAPDYTVTLHYLQRGETIVYARIIGDEDSMVMISIHMPYSTSVWIWIALAVAMIVAGRIFYYLKSRKRSLIPSGNSGDMESHNEDGNAEAQSTGRNEKYATFNISKKECAEIMKTIHKILTVDKPYTNPDLKLPEVAKMAGISPNKLSYVLRQHSNIGFYDFINNYRIEEFKNIVKSGKWKDLTLTAMSEKAGFSSRTSFFRCFKKIEGITPGEYIRNL